MGKTRPTTLIEPASLHQKLWQTGYGVGYLLGLVGRKISVPERPLLKIVPAMNCSEPQAVRILTQCRGDARRSAIAEAGDTDAVARSTQNGSPCACGIRAFLLMTSLIQ
jgi:hypothetical protein